MKITLSKNRNLKLFLLSIILFLLRIPVTAAQSNQLDNFPLSVVMKVQDVCSVINLSADRQLALANFFQKEINSVSSALQAGANGSQINVLKASLKAEFQSLFTTEELTLYSSKKKGAEYGLAPNTGTSTQ